MAGALRRGDVVLVTFPGDYGKARPAVVVQADDLAGDDGPDSALLCPMTTFVSGAVRYRVPVAPTPGNGLAAPSEVIIEKMAGVARRRVREIVGRLGDEDRQALDRALLLVLGFA